MQILELLLKRHKNADIIDDYANWRIGLSAAASWSWGVSLAVGMSIMYTKGILPFLIWTTGNILAIPLFGFMYTFFPLTRKWPRFIVPMVVLFLFVEFFCIVLNLQGLLTGFGGNVAGIVSYQFLSPQSAKYVVMAIGLFVIWYIYVGGLRMSVLTDFGQYAVQLTSVIVMSIIGYAIGDRHDLEWIVVTETVNGLVWAKFAFFGIIVGVLGTSHQWQRFSSIKEKNVLKVSLWAGFWFGIYMVFVGLTALNFKPNIFLGIIFLITMIALATSSVDSAVAGLEYVTKRFGLERFDISYRTWIDSREKTLTLRPYHIGCLLAVVATFFWPYFMSGSMADIWSFMAAQRLKIVGTFIIITVLITFYRKIVKKP